MLFTCLIAFQLKNIWNGAMISWQAIQINIQNNWKTCTIEQKHYILHISHISNLLVRSLNLWEAVEPPIVFFRSPHRQQRIFAIFVTVKQRRRSQILHFERQPWQPCRRVVFGRRTAASRRPMFAAANIGRREACVGAKPKKSVTDMQYYLFQMPLHIPHWQFGIIPYLRARFHKTVKQ